MITAPAPTAEPPRRRITRVVGPPQTPDELRELVRRAFGVSIPDTQVCQHHSTPWRAFCDAFFATAPGSVWVGSRGLGGKTYLLSVLAASQAVFLGANVTILGGSGGQSQNAFKYIQQFLSSPNLQGGFGVRHTSRKSKLTNGAQIEALMASGTSVRGGHPDRQGLDELDEMKLEILIAALGQTQSSRMRPHVVASSTHHHPDGTMTYALKHAAEKGWPIHQWCYRESSAGPGAWLTQQMIDDKRATMPAGAWRIEAELQEPTAGDRAIAPAAVDRMFDRALGVFSAGPKGASPAVEIEAPQPGATYATGADWGRKRHFSDFAVLRTDVKPMRLVAHQRIRFTEWPHMVEAFVKLISRYRGPASHDATGVGDWPDGLFRLNGLRVDGVVMSPGPRRTLFSNYICGIEADEIRAPYIEAVATEHRYCSQADLFGGGHPPDSFVGLAMAYRAATSGKKPAVPVVGVIYGSAPSPGGSGGAWEWGG